MFGKNVQFLSVKRGVTDGISGKQKGKIFLVHPMKAYRASVGMAPLILDLGTRRK